MFTYLPKIFKGNWPIDRRRKMSKIGWKWGDLLQSSYIRYNVFWPFWFWLGPLYIVNTYTEWKGWACFHCIMQNSTKLNERWWIVCRDKQAFMHGKDLFIGVIFVIFSGIDLGKRWRGPSQDFYKETWKNVKNSVTKPFMRHTVKHVEMQHSLSIHGHGRIS